MSGAAAGPTRAATRPITGSTTLDGHRDLELRQATAYTSGMRSAPEEQDDREGIDEDEDEETPEVLVATLADLGRHLPEGLRKSFGARPCWFLRRDDEELVEIFD